MKSKKREILNNLLLSMFVGFASAVAMPIDEEANYLTSLALRIIVLFNTACTFDYIYAAMKENKSNE